MYHCHIRFYLLTRQVGSLEAIREIPPLEGFTHTFSGSAEPQADLIRRADVILADLEGADAGAVLAALAADMRPEAELILLAGREQTGRLAGSAPAQVRDIWTAPLSEGELRFRFLKWQEGHKLRKDLWQARQFLDTTINESPNLIWYKTKDGIHEKVNDRFCQTAGKSREQVEGQMHADVWNVVGAGGHGEAGALRQ